MMRTYGPMKIYMDGVEVCEATDVTFDPGTPGGDSTVLHAGWDEETTFLALAMFRRRMRPDAERLSEGRDDGTDRVLDQMWLRAQARAVPMRWTCQECGLHAADDARQDGSDSSHWHVVPFTGGRCGPLQLDPIDPSLRKVHDECVAEAILVARECEDLTLADYPGTLSAWQVERGDPAHPCTPDDQLPSDDPEADAKVGPVAKAHYEASTTIEIPASEAKGLLDFIGRLDRVLDHVPHMVAVAGTATGGHVPGICVAVKDVTVDKGAKILRTQADLDAHFGVGSGMAKALAKLLPVYAQHTDIDGPGLGKDLQERLRVVQYLRQEETELRALAASSRDEPASRQMRRTADSLGGRASAIQMGEHVTKPTRCRQAAIDDMVDAYAASMMASVPTLETATGPELDRIAKMMGLPPRRALDCGLCGDTHATDVCPFRKPMRLQQFVQAGDDLRDREEARKKAAHTDQMAQLRALHRDRAQVAELEKLPCPDPWAKGDPWVVAYDAESKVLLSAPMSPDGKAVFPTADRAMTVDHVAIHVAGLTLPVDCNMTRDSSRHLSPGHTLDLQLDAAGLNAARQHVFGL